MEIIQDYSLKELNTFGIESKTSYYASFENISELKEIIEIATQKLLPILILGGGSNILFTGDFNGMVIHPEITGIKKASESKYYINFKVGAGLKWDDFVAFCVNKNYWGVENLSNIPGNVGSSPIQNIGAYGVEVKDTIQYVELLDLADKKIKAFNNGACNFEYRNSIFNNVKKGKYVILNVVFRLSKKPNPILKYGKLEEKVLEFGEKSIQNIRNAIIEIRSQKLPNPLEVRNAGSFFKNPIVSKEHSSKLISAYKDISVYPVNDKTVKISAAWLIEKCGWKGYKKGNVGVYKNQSLVIVNKGNATGPEILELAEEIRESVFAKFKIMLKPEVSIV